MESEKGEWFVEELVDVAVVRMNTETQMTQPNVWRIFVNSSILPILTNAVLVT